MKTHLLSLLAILWLSPWSFLHAITINGQIRNAPRPEVTLNVVFGAYPVKSDDITIPLDAAGNFSYELQPAEIRVAQLNYGERTLQLFLTPAARTLTVQLDATDWENTLQFSGDLVAENEYINRHTYSNPYRQLEDLKPEARNNPAAWDQAVAEETGQKLAILSGLKDKMTPANYAFLVAEQERYGRVLQILAGVFVGYRDRKAYEKEWMQHNDSLSQLVDCDAGNRFALQYNILNFVVFEHFSVKHHLLYVEDSIAWLKRYEVEDMQVLAELMGPDSHNFDVYVIGKENFCDNILEKMLANRIHHSAADGDFENLSMVFEKFKARFPQSPYLAQLTAEMEPVYQFEKNKEREVGGMNFYPRQALESSMLSVLQSDQYRGRVIFVDIWGTWCSPCREQFAYMKAIKEELHDEDIAYIYFADERLQKPEKHWMETIKFFGLKGDHYIVSKNLVFQFMKDIDHYSPRFEYPTYMIVNRQGEIVFHDAADPSSGEVLVAQIRSVLAE